MTKQEDRGGEEEPFLQRWARRKTEEETETGEPTPAPALEEENPIVKTDGDPETEDIIADLPDIDSLDKDSDYTGFLRKGVPDALKNMALRKLWLSDPVFANLDGLNDYDEDFGAILKAGAEYMQKLKDAGEKLTRPGSEEPEEQDAENENPDTQQPDSGEPDPREPDVRKPGSADFVMEDAEEAESDETEISLSDTGDDAPPETGQVDRNVRSDPSISDVPDSENSST